MFKYHRISSYLLLVVSVQLFSAIFIRVINKEGLPDIIEVGDSVEYKYVANSLIDGNGFLSNEKNQGERAYLGNNYFYVAEPGYPLFLAGFYNFFKNDAFVIVVSNTLIYCLLITLCFKITELMNIRPIFSVLVLVGLTFHVGINFYSKLLLPELARVLLFLIMFLASMIFLKREKITFSEVVFLSFISSISILFRTPFIVLVVPFIVLIFKVSTKNYSYHNVFFYLIFLVVFLSPWAIRNYNSFGFLNVDPRFHRKMDYQEVILRKYRITDNALYQDMKGMNEYEKNQLFKKSNPSVFNFIYAYILKMKEFFRLYPSGGVYSNIPSKVASAIFNLPYIMGILFLYTSRHFKNSLFWNLWKLGIALFIFFHLIAAGPHARYFLPLVPVGYFTFGKYLSNLKIP